MREVRIERGSLPAGMYCLHIVDDLGKGAHLRVVLE